jgi:large subunit ribosomal protein L4
MFKARYYKADGKKGRARALPDVLFDGVVNEAVLHQVVKAYLSNQRQGTHSAKNRAAVSGGHRKPWRQKGTGRARQGTIRAVQWEGGGRAFPPIPHSWEQKVPRKVRALARRSAFNTRAEDERVVLIDALALEAPRTAVLRDYLASIELGGRKVLLLTDGHKEIVYLSARNLPEVEVRPFGQEAAYDILWADTVVIERGAIDRLGATETAAASDTEVAEDVAEDEEANDA